MKIYLYRCTEQQLEAHLQRIAEAGDTVEQVLFKGGRDYVLVCRKAEPTVADLTATALEDLIVRAIGRARCDAHREAARGKRNAVYSSGGVR